MKQNKLQDFFKSIKDYIVANKTIAGLIAGLILAFILLMIRG